MNPKIKAHQRHQLFSRADGRGPEVKLAAGARNSIRTLSGRSDSLATSGARISLRRNRVESGSMRAGGERVAGRRAGRRADRAAAFFRTPARQLNKLNFKN